MGIYGKAAILATDSFVGSKASSPSEAWRSAVRRFSAKLSSQTKVCPRHAYLGRCEAGIISGIPPGKYGAPSKNKNGQYALQAYRVLKSEPGMSVNKAALWARAVSPESKKENGQMDVVISLWNKRMLG